MPNEQQRKEIARSARGRRVKMYRRVREDITEIGGDAWVKETSSKGRKRCIISKVMFWREQIKQARKNCVCM